VETAVITATSILDPVGKHETEITRWNREEEK
jgi:hypothetical protein